MTSTSHLLVSAACLSLLASCHSTNGCPGPAVSGPGSLEWRAERPAAIGLAVAPASAPVASVASAGPAVEPAWQPDASSALLSLQQQPPVIVEDHSSTGINDNFVLGVHFGQRSIDSNEFTPVDDPWSFGVDLAIKPGDMPIAVEFGTLLAGRTNAGVDLALGELYLGGRLYLLPGYRLRPFVSGGGTLMTAELSQGGFATNETSTGFYLRAGAMLAVTDFFSIGADYRWVLGTEYDLEFAGLGGPDSDLDYGQWSAGLMFHF